MSEWQGSPEQRQMTNQPPPQLATSRTGRLAWSTFIVVVDAAVKVNGWLQAAHTRRHQRAFDARQRRIVTRYLRRLRL